MENKKENFNNIDLFKLIFSIVVIAIHTQPYIAINNIYIRRVIMIFNDFAVPFFFITSGFLVFKRMNFPYYDEESLFVLKRSIIKHIKLYVFCRLIYLPLDIYYHSLSGNTLLKNILIYLRGFFITGGYYEGSDVFWYLLSTIYAMSLIYILLKNRIKEKYIFVICFSLTLFGYLCKILTTNNYEIAETFINVIKITISNGRVFNGFVYVFIGMLLAHINIFDKYKYIVFIVAYIFEFITFENTSLIRKFILIVCLLFFYEIIIDIKFQNIKRGFYLRNVSKINYIFHPYTIKFICYLTDNRITNVKKFFYSTILCLIFGYIYCKFLNKRKKRNEH